MAATIQHPYNAADWTVTIDGHVMPWQTLEFTFEQYHVPASFAFEVPLNLVDIPTVLASKIPVVVISRKGKEYFRGQLDESNASFTEDQPEGVIMHRGRDLAARLILKKIDTALPMNLTASQLVTQWAKEAGLTDFSQITPTSTLVGAFLKTDTSHVTRGMDRFSIIFDLASFENFIFRVKGNAVFFGPAPSIPRENIRKIEYQKDFNRMDWRKNHTNGDVTVRVMGSTSRKKKISQSAGTGSIVIEHIETSRHITPLEAKNIADKLVEQIERGLVTGRITEMQGDHTLNDINFAFDVVGTGKGISQRYWPSQIHHVLTQDDHVMDITLFNKAGLSI